MDKFAKWHRTSHQDGFTLIEIAIVIIIIGLILGGVLKGQELIRSARTHSVADQGSAVKSAIMGFADRYRALPGDYDKAAANIPGVASGQDGDGNGRVGYNDSKTPGTPDEANRLLESGLVWLHLAKAGFISGSFDGKPLRPGDLKGWGCPSETCMMNAFNGPMLFIYANEQTGVSWASDSANSNQLWVGKNIPSELISELDRKMDDGKPSTGNFRAGDGFVEGAPTLVGNSCAVGGKLPKKEQAEGLPFSWDLKNQAVDCGAVLLF
ncbi:MAG: prepilin-type N-terminal cleavage/methylation domain-containing protein [Magnetococcales bacterium]|nr:prepilin-type N-terminal cleavage/methylation domain-containing protein [Magnetococcales bacterium]